MDREGKLEIKLFGEDEERLLNIKLEIKKKVEESLKQREKND